MTRNACEIEDELAQGCAAHRVDVEQFSVECSRRRRAFRCLPKFRIVKVDLDFGFC